MAAVHPTTRSPIRRRSLSEPTLATTDLATTTRSVFCGSPEPTQSAIRVRIRYQDDALRLRSQANSRQLIQSALDDSNQLSNSARIAKKALRYRKIFDRMAGVDVNDPTFDASGFLGVDWCKTLIITGASDDEAQVTGLKTAPEGVEGVNPS